MKETHTLVNIKQLENVNYTEEDRLLAASLELDDNVIKALVELIFSQKDRELPS